ncbi:MAG: carbohydrate-binding domain-containing protein [Prevotella sp.]|nr:carbohydrate-binding domain-containing protein [Prevotella sp.]
MRKIFAMMLATASIVACTDDDTYSLDYFQEKYGATTDTTQVVTTSDTLSVSIVYSGSTAQVTGDVDSVSVTLNGADITINSTSQKFLELALSGSTDDGSLLVYNTRSWGLILNGVTITNGDGPAINNQCSKALYVTLNDSTVLTDGTSYTETSFQQKGTFFSEGQIYIDGTGSLTINGNAKNGLACDDYIIMQGGKVNVNVSDAGNHGVKVNDGFTMEGGTLAIDVKGDGARGIKCDARVTIAGGDITIATSGDCLTEEVDGVEDVSTCAGVKCDSLFTMTAGTLTISSSGDGGKGINCADSVKFMGGTLVAKTTGSNDEGKPKAVKGDKGIYVSGGSFTASCNKSWALDNGVDTDVPSERVTIIGSPTVNSVQKRSVVIKYE